MSAALQLPRTNMTDAEWQTRCELAALYHVVNHVGWTDLINTHMSARIPGEPNTFLINNYGEMFDEITASSLVKMDMAGNVLSPNGKFNNAGFIIHSGVYKARPDANCVLHTHTRAGAGVSLLRKGLRPISQDALHVLDDIVYHEYGVPATVEECDALGMTRALRLAARRAFAALPPGAHPNAVLGSALSITLDYRIPVFFCSSRQAACQFVQAYLLGAHARWKA